MKLQNISDQNEPKLAKLGFRLNIFGFTRFISITGIIISVLGLAGGIFSIYRWSNRLNYDFGVIYVAAASINVAAAFGWLVMNCLLLRRCQEKKILAIEKLTKIVNYVMGTLEILGCCCGIISNVINLLYGSTFIPAFSVAIAT